MVEEIASLDWFGQCRSRVCMIQMNWPILFVTMKKLPANSSISQGAVFVFNQNSHFLAQPREIFLQALQQAQSAMKLSRMLLRNVMMKVAKSSLNNVGHLGKLQHQSEAYPAYTNLYNFLSNFYHRKTPFYPGSSFCHFLSAPLFAGLFTSRYVH